MGRKKLAFCFSQVCSKEDGRDPSLVPAQGECKIMIPPEGSRGIETVSARIIKVDPAGGDLVYRIVDGPETIFGQTTRNPLIKILTGLISHDFELA